VSLLISRDSWAAKITAAWQSSFAGIIECGRLLVSAKEQLDHGEWLRMIEGELPFKRTTAQSLMKIGQDERITKGQHVGLLPPHWGTLVELTRLPDDVFAAKIADGTIHPEMQRKDITTSFKKEQRADRELDLAAKQVALPDRKFGVILADPEWRFEPYSRETGMDRAVDNHYPTSVSNVIADRPVQQIAADDAVLFLWATVPMLPDALRVMAAWGFEYKSHCVWAKDRVGTGYWFRNQHELLLVGTKGSVPAPAMGTQIASLVSAPVGRHSEKPAAFYELIEGYFPTLPKIELNARTARPGWDAWGYEAPAEAAE
jgi:N6-adenosine-specific RNA methylase IME4